MTTRHTDLEFLNAETIEEATRKIVANFQLLQDPEVPETVSTVEVTMMVYSLPDEQPINSPFLYSESLEVYEPGELHDAVSKWVKQHDMFFAWDAITNIFDPWLDEVFEAFLDCCDEEFEPPVDNEDPAEWAVDDEDDDDLPDWLEALAAEYDYNSSDRFDQNLPSPDEMDQHI